MTLQEIKEDALAWCREDRSVIVRLPVLAYGFFLLWKTALHPNSFTPFDFLNLGIHELGHMVFMPFGEWIGVAGGSAAQILAPIFGAWQFFRQRDYFAVAFSLGWLGESLANLSVYIGDARKQELPLVSPFGGDPLHDWNYLLASINRLQLDSAYAKRVQGLGFLSAFAFVLLGSWLLLEMVRGGRTEEHE
jgi:hypothetical protein